MPLAQSEAATFELPGTNRLVPAAARGSSAVWAVLIIKIAFTEAATEAAAQLHHGHAQARSGCLNRNTPELSRTPTVTVTGFKFTECSPASGDAAEVRSGQVRYITRPKSEAMGVTRQLK